MRYYRCKCGEHKAWSSMGVPDCRGCDKCGMTLAEHPDEHRALAPHEWTEEWGIDKQSGERFRVRQCVKCFKRERVPNADADRREGR